MSGLRRHARSALGIALCAVGGVSAVPGTSHASVTVGNDLSDPPVASPVACPFSPQPCTRLLSRARPGNLFGSRSLTAGTVTSFGIRTGSAGTVTFRLARILSQGRARGAGTGSTVTLPGPGIYSIPASLPIKPDYLIGIDSSSTGAISGGCGLGFQFVFNFVLSDTRATGPKEGRQGNGCDLLVNAIIRPSNGFKFRKVRFGARGGTLAVKVPGPGNLVLRGTGVRPYERRADLAGITKLKLRPTGGSSSARIAVTFSPVGGSPRTRRAVLPLG